GARRLVLRHVQRRELEHRGEHRVAGGQPLRTRQHGARPAHREVRGEVRLVNTEGTEKARRHGEGTETRRKLRGLRARSVSRYRRIGIIKDPTAWDATSETTTCSR